MRGKNRISVLFVLFSLCIASDIFILCSDAEAIPPPEIVRLGSVFIQVLGFSLIFLSTSFYLVRNKIRSILASLQGRRIKLLLLAVPAFVVVIALAGSVVYVKNKNRDSDLFAEGFDVKDAAMITGGIMTVGGVQLDVADPSFMIEPKEAIKFLGNDKYLFIDIREPIEFTTRHVPGFINIRFGDLVAGEEYKKLDKKKTIVTMCELGERGSSVAVFLRLKGYQAFYIDKGIRGWQKEKLEVAGINNMRLPEFKNMKKKVSTEDAKALIAGDKAVLVDVRSPAEFEKEHVTGAQNIPLQNMPSKDLEKALNQLPKDKLVIGVAYDRSDAYFCKIIGYMIDQKKMEYGGTLIIKRPRNQPL